MENVNHLLNWWLFWIFWNSEFNLSTIDSHNQTLVFRYPQKENMKLLVGLLSNALAEYFPSKFFPIFFPSSFWLVNLWLIVYEPHSLSIHLLFQIWLIYYMWVDKIYNLRFADGWSFWLCEFHNESAFEKRFWKDAIWR